MAAYEEKMAAPYGEGGCGAAGSRAAARRKNRRRRTK